MISDDKTVVSSLMSTAICSQFSVYLSNQSPRLLFFMLFKISCLFLTRIPVTVDFQAMH